MVHASATLPLADQDVGTMTADRPTGPATAAEEDRIRREFLDELVASGVVATPLMPFAEIKETLARFERLYRFVIEQETKARILAALPEALAATHPRDWALESDAERMQHFREDAAALTAAIEKILEDKE